MRSFLSFQEELCLACKACELACSVVHSKSGSLREAVEELPSPRRRVSVKATDGGIEALRCAQCGEPVCVFSCKTGALGRDPESGKIHLDPMRCVGCWMCFMVCSQGIRPDADADQALRCDVCLEKETQACADACPTGALSLREEEKARVDHGFDGRVLIVGSSAAGIAACEAAREYAPQASITLVTSDEEVGYSRPLLAYLLSGELPKENLNWKPEGFLEQTLGVKILRGVQAWSLDTERRAVRLDYGGEVFFDRLIIATGARGSMPDIPGVTLDGVFALRNMDDVEGIEARATAGGKAVVLGGGNVGLQVCEALLAKGMEVTVVVGSPHLLSQMVDAEAGRRVGELFARNGLTLRTGHEAVEITGDQTAGGVRLNDRVGGELLPADLVVVGKGVRPNIEWLDGSSIQTGWGITVDATGQTNVEGVFAAGDCAETKDPITGQMSVSGIWPVAYEMGRAAGSTAVGETRKAAGALRMNASRFFHVPMISIGEVRVEKLDGAECRVLVNTEEVYRAFVHRQGKICGAMLYNDISSAGLFYRLYREGVKIDDGVLEKLEDRDVERVLNPLVTNLTRERENV